MTHLPFAITAYFFNALSVLSNKFLLNKAIPDPVIYIFYISSVSLIAILAIPFVKMPTFGVFVLASLYTLFWSIGVYFMFKALKNGQVSRVIPVIGTLIPLILLIFASQTNSVSSSQIWAILILALGMILLNLSEFSPSLFQKEILWEILAGSFFAASYILLRQAYLNSNFLSVLVWSKLILLPLGLILIAIPKIRRKIFTSQGPKINFFSLTGLIFIGGMLSGAISELLILFSISLANPALVNSLQGTQYVFLLFLAREKHSLKILISKIAGVITIGIGLYILAFA